MQMNYLGEYYMWNYSYFLKNKLWWLHKAATRSDYRKWIKKESEYQGLLETSSATRNHVEVLVAKGREGKLMVRQNSSTALDGPVPAEIFKRC